MDLAAALADCRLCPRACGVNRLAGERGFCGAGVETEVFRYGPHHGEEPPVSGSRGSGTVFFSRCTLRCGYCQNHPWSQEGQGEPLAPEALAGVFEALRLAGCHNWNLVSPTPWLPAVAACVREARRQGRALPVVYNTSGFERPEVLEALADVADVYLTDLRYARPETAREGSGAASYAAVARTALLRMWEQKGPLRVDAEGLARTGTICRLLILPGRAGEAVDNLRWLAGAVGTEIAVSVMAQYRPLYRAADGRMDASWGRGITEAEYGLVVAAVEELGFGSGWMQDFQAETPDGLVGCEMARGPAVGLPPAEQTGAARGSLGETV